MSRASTRKVLALSEHLTALKHQRTRLAAMVEYWKEVEKLLNEKREDEAIALTLKQMLRPPALTDEECAVVEPLLARIDIILLARGTP